MDASQDEATERPDPRWEFVLAECRRSLDVQVRDLDAVRARAGGLVTLAVAVATFVAGAFIAGKVGDPTCLSWAGFAGLALAVVMGFEILRPRTFSFALDLDYMTAMAEGEGGVNDLLRSATAGYRDNKRQNQDVLNSLHNRYSIGLAAVSVSPVLVLAGVAFY